MGRALPFCAALAIIVGLVGITSHAQAVITHPLARALPHHRQPEKQRDPGKFVTETARLAAIRKAQVWTRTSIPDMDLRAGPQGRGAFQPNQMVTCDYVETPKSGSSRKFDCKIGKDDVVKVRYGEFNGKVEGAVLASRLLWALGFGADAVYPVRVTCRGCSADPFNKRERVEGEQVFDPAAIDRKPAGKTIDTATHAGWEWPELDLVDEAAGGAPKAQRDALTLLAVLMQHTDNKDEQQRLVCLSGRLRDDGSCEKPFMLLHDVGNTCGHANLRNRDISSAVNFDLLSTTPIWRDAASCKTHLSKSLTGTLGDDPNVSEAGRQFLANLLVQLSDQQLRDLFEVARVDRRSRKPYSSEPAASVAEWVAAFKHKRDEIVGNRCPSPVLSDR